MSATAAERFPMRPSETCFTILFLAVYLPTLFAIVVGACRFVTSYVEGYGTSLLVIARTVAVAAPHGRGSR